MLGLLFWVQNTILLFDNNIFQGNNNMTKSIGQSNVTMSYNSKDIIEDMTQLVLHYVNPETKNGDILYDSKYTDKYQIQVSEENKIDLVLLGKPLLFLVILWRNKISEISS